ncbi:MAG: FKBP-type peptidyl-prolyl cis-trans isomerase [Anaerolineae bacterium]|nr:FKBP-type peptidyl-prolyl cis-trans isomerase [Anaerolineae bacterium]
MTSNVKQTISWLFAAAILTLLLAACGAAVPETVTPVADDETPELIRVELTVETLFVGNGPRPQMGEVVGIHYIGYLDDGTEFDNSYFRNQPAVFAVGRGMVIPGWEQAVLKMNLGERAKVTIPPEMAFGPEGVPGIIPPNAPLIMEIELLFIKPGSPELPAATNPADFVTTDSGLQYVDLVVGDGPLPETNGIVSVHYTGWLEDGKKFDSSIDRDDPITFVLGKDQVIPGWEEGVASMRVGGKRQMIIPADLAYGATGYQNFIPPNAVLTFDVELLAYYAPAPAAPTEIDEADLVTTESGLQYVDLVVGTGEVARSGYTVSVHYTGWLTDTTKFDSSLDRGTPLEFVLGEGRVIVGWEEGLVGMRVGGRRQLIIPSDLAYGDLGQGIIPGGATLIFEVELIETKAPLSPIPD